MTKYLVMTTSDNHNKFYRMIEEDERSFMVEYGRVGAKPQKRRYPMSQWNNKLNEKLRKGYVDQSVLHSKTVGTEFEPIKDEKVRRMVSILLERARNFIKKKYYASVNEVTLAMIKSAETVIDSMESFDYSVEEFNKVLLNLFTIIPRRMANVSDYLAEKETDYPEIINRERDTLNVLAGQVKLNKGTPANGEDILEKSGLEIRPCTSEEIKDIKRFLSEESVGHFKAAYYVKNMKTEERFNQWCKTNDISKSDIHFYYHGSLSENFWSILSKGLALNPNARTAGKMFGHGLYFALRARKSMRYTDIGDVHTTQYKNGFLAVFKVAYKNQMDVHEWDQSMTSYTLDYMKRKGYDALFAHKGKSLINDEIIVYDPAQITIRYLIELE